MPPRRYSMTLDAIQVLLALDGPGKGWERVSTHWVKLWHLTKEAKPCGTGWARKHAMLAIAKYF